MFMCVPANARTRFIINAVIIYFMSVWCLLILMFLYSVILFLFRSHSFPSTHNTALIARVRKKMALKLLQQWHLINKRTMKLSCIAYLFAWVFVFLCSGVYRSVIKTLVLARTKCVWWWKILFQTAVSKKKIEKGWFNGFIIVRWFFESFSLVHLGSHFHWIQSTKRRETLNNISDDDIE